MTKTAITNNRKKTCNNIWFSGTYSQKFETDIEKTFLKLIKKHFPRDHRLYKIFIRNTLILS